MNIAITGATGFIGRQLVAELESSGHRYHIVTRDGRRAQSAFPGASGIHEWNFPVDPLDPSALEGLDGVIHMAGAPVAQRWTAAAKRTIEESRILYTRGLVDALEKTERRPPVLIGFSAIGYYGVRDDTRLDENAECGTDFLAGVCRGWEAEAMRASTFGIRVVNPRIGIVIGRGGGALSRMLPPFRLGIGGPIGDGRQWMSWIHIRDVVGIVSAALTDDSLDGPVNATAPEPVTNRDFSKALGRALHRPAFLPVPVFALKLMFGGFADILATGQRVVPQKAIASGYAFQYPELEDALAEAVS